MNEKLFNTINKTVVLTSDDVQLCGQFFETVFISKNTTLEEQDKIPSYLYFISSGFVRLFYKDENGDEITTNLSSSNAFIASFMSLIHQKKAKENVECITECEIVKIHRNNLLSLIDKSENFKQFSLIIFEHAITTTENRANDLATLSAELRYKKLMENQPKILQNVPIQYIASFLGMKPESLSRIRRQMSNG